MKTILLENGGESMLRGITINWINKIDEKFILINSETKTYMKSDDLWTYGMFIDPSLTDIATMSAFPNIMGFDAEKANGRNEEKKWLQIEWYSYLIYNAVAWRKRNKMTPITIHIAYEGEDFLRDVDREELGEDTKSYIMLMMRQSEGSVILKLYNPEDGKLLKTITKESQLKFTR